MKDILVFVERLKGLTIAVGTADATYEKVLNFVEEEIMNPFGPPKAIISEKASLFISKGLGEFILNNVIGW